MKVKRKKVWAVFLLIILCSFFVSVAAEPFWYRERVQADTMTAAPQLAVQTVSLEQTALQIRINSTLRIFLAAVAVILAAGRQSARYFPKLQQIHTGDSWEIICYIHKTDGKKKNASM